MADLETPKKSKGLKRCAFLGGSVGVVGGGLFAVHWRQDAANKAGEAITTKDGAGSFNGWVKIGTDGAITLYVPTADMGQGSHTAMAQMLAEELDADLSAITVETAPAEYAFANSFVWEGTAKSAVTLPGFMTGTLKAASGMMARRMDFQQSSGSNAISHTGQFGMRVSGAAALLRTNAGPTYDQIGAAMTKLCPMRCRSAYSKCHPCRH
jgi:isoquinoline 1-oxidoreductase subunit beta